MPVKYTVIYKCHVFVYIIIILIVHFQRNIDIKKFESREFNDKFHIHGYIK